MTPDGDTSKCFSAVVPSFTFIYCRWMCPKLSTTMSYTRTEKDNNIA